MSGLLPNITVTPPSNADVLTEASRMTNIERFFHLWRHAKLLVEKYGPYSTHEGTTVFTRASETNRPINDPPMERLAYSLAAAQDCVNSAQPEGPAKDDLLLFKRLWETAITILESILALGSLPQESFGWGIFALSSGYMRPHPSSSPSYNHLVARNIFSSHKYRLHAALRLLPSMDGERRSEYVVSEKTKLDALVKARRMIHTCGHILLDEFRKGNWSRVRWFHAVEVCERWIRAFGLVPQTVREEVPAQLQKKLPETESEDAQEGLKEKAQERTHVQVDEEKQEIAYEEAVKKVIVKEEIPETESGHARQKEGEKMQEPVPERKVSGSEVKPKLPEFSFPQVQSPQVRFKIEGDEYLER